MRDTTHSGLNFTVEVDAPTELAFDATRADALLTVHASYADEAAGDAAGNATRSAEILIMDRSLSMAGLGKLDEAKRAICAAVDTLRDGTLLGIVAGHHQAEVVYPRGGGLARVDSAVKREAKGHVVAQLPEGGTAIGQWLACARSLFDTSAGPGTVRHAVLYTDGKDEHETRDELDAVLRDCADRFTCDVRGLGEDWQYAELLRITEALQGTAEAIIDVADLTEDFVRLMHQAQRIVVPRAYLGLRINSVFRLEFVRQTRPVQADLTSQRQQFGDEIHIPLGAWSPGDRQYEMSLRFDPEALPVGERLRAARITLHTELPDGQRRVSTASPQALVVRRHHSIPDNDHFFFANRTRIENERELGMAMRACVDEYLQGNHQRADMELRQALLLAEQLDDHEQAARLRSVAGRGPDNRAIVRRNVTRGELQRIGLGSTKTRRPPADALQPDTVDAATDTLHSRCPHCGAALPSGVARYCEGCGRQLDAGNAE
ncbi:VWA domain-containing protein [Streptomyces sp. NBC_01304]|uniref:VWA domain-containing protein n=1 Tax=Streptomyces sp. NBC_01304 TaxID=2903818 RepID=UPI002E129B4F|nr:VWA domain-containing protein [Streptomyces sp. NBC_01304]